MDKAVVWMDKEKKIERERRTKQLVGWLREKRLRGRDGQRLRGRDGQSSWLDGLGKKD